MKRFSIFHPYYMSFYSKDLYRDVAGNWKTGTVFGYLFCLLALCWIPMSVKFHLGVNEFVKYKAPEMLRQLPTVTIANGQVSIDKPMPYVITYSGKPCIIFDTTGQTSPENYGPIVFVAKDRIFYKKGANKPAVVNIPPSRNIRVTREYSEHILGIIGKWLGLAYYLVGVPYSFAYRVVQVLLLALIGMFFVKLSRTGLRYAALVRLTAVSFTPVIIIETLVYLTGGTKVPHPLLAEFIVTMGYLYFGIKANTQGELFHDGAL